MTHNQEPAQPQPSELDPPSETAAADQATAELAPMRNPQIWVGSLLDYNNGLLHGRWLAAATEVDELRAQIHDVLSTSPTMSATGEPAEEWAILDSDDFAGFSVGEHQDLDMLTRVARGISEHGDAFAAWADLHDGDEAILGQFEDAFLGEYDSPQAWAESVMDDLGVQAQIDAALPGELARYVRLDTEAWAHDAWLSGEIAVVHRSGGGVWIFTNR